MPLAEKLPAGPLLVLVWGLLQAETPLSVVAVRQLADCREVQVAHWAYLDQRHQVAAGHFLVQTVPS